MLRRIACAVLVLLLVGFDWLGKVELDAELLTSEIPQTRLKGVQRLARYDIAYTRDILLRALRDADPKVRAAAGRVLAEFGVEDAIGEVVGWLRESDADIKREAAVILGTLGAPSAVPPLVRSLGDPDADVRLQVIVALGAIGTPEVVVPLLGRLQDDKPEVRRAAVQQLAKLGDPRAAIPLVGAFDDASIDVRIEAVRAVGALGDRAAIPALLRLIRDPVDRVRIAAVTALGTLEATQAVDLLVEQLDRAGASPGYRAKVAYALGKLGKSGDRRALDVLVAALAEPRLREPATEALRLTGAAATPALIAHLQGELPGDPATAVSLLREATTPEATLVLIAELDRGRVSRELVLGALGATGDERALVPVLALISDPDPAVRGHAMTALEPLLSPRAADVLIAALADPELSLRTRAADYLGRIAARAAVPALLELATSDDRLRARWTAIQSLGAIGDRRATPTLLRLLGEAPSPLRRAASDALVYIADPAAVAPLRALASDGPTISVRALAVRSLGGVLRDRRDDVVRALLERAATEASLPEALAAIDALGAMGDARAAATLLALARGQQLERRRAALWTLGDLRGEDAREALLVGLSARDDRVASAAAWALGKLPSADATRAALARAVDRSAWATAINAAGALARLATDADRARMSELLLHPSRFVRVNAAFGVGRLAVTDARASLEHMLSRDPSWVARVAASRALSRLGDADDALGAAERDPDGRVRRAARAVRAKPFSPPARREWRSFYVVDPDDDDAAVGGEPYLVIGADGLVTALYTDARGEATEERFPRGSALVVPRAESDRY